MHAPRLRGESERNWVDDLERSKVKVSRSIQLDEREVDEMYETSAPKQRPIIQITEECDEGRAPTRPDRVERDSVQDEPMEDVEKPIQGIEMDAVEPTQGASMNMLLPSAEPSTGLQLTDTAQHSQYFRTDSDPTWPRSKMTGWFFVPNWKPVLLIEDGPVIHEERTSQGSDGPPSPRRARIDEDVLIAEAILAYAASIVDAADPLSTYAQAMARSDAD